MNQVFSQIFDNLKKEIDNVWGNANFGTMGRIDVVKHGLLKIASGYQQGHTSKCILTELRMITENGRMTKKGRYWLWKLWAETEF